jgi:hypothetical protein
VLIEHVLCTQPCSGWDKWFKRRILSQNKSLWSWVLVAHTCNPSYSGGRDQEDHSLRPALANSSQDPISNILNTRKRAGVTQVIEHLPGKYEALNSNPSTVKRKKCI